MAQDKSDKTVKVLRTPDKRDKTFQVLIAPDKTDKTIAVLRVPYEGEIMMRCKLRQRKQFS